MSMIQRYSKKRAAILERIATGGDHPSAEMVFRDLKPIYPDLSLGTVYRNISQLKENGDIITVTRLAGEERYDSARPHAHLICRQCGRIVDLQDLPELSLFRKAAQKSSGFMVEREDVTLRGLCPDCAKE